MSIASLGGHLILAGTNQDDHPVIYAYSPLLPAWLCVGEFCNTLRLMTATVLPTGQLVLMARGIHGMDDIYLAGLKISYKCELTSIT